MDEWTCEVWINELYSNGQVPLANPPQSAHLYIYLCSRLWPTKSSQRGPFISANRAASRMRRRGMSNLDSLALVKQELFPLGPGESRSSRKSIYSEAWAKGFQPKWPKTGSQQVLQMRRKPWQPVDEMLLGATWKNLPPASQSALGPTDTKCGQQLWTRLESQLCLSVSEEYDEACWYTPRFISLTGQGLALMLGWTRAAPRLSLVQNSYNTCTKSQWVWRSSQIGTPNWL